MPHSEPTAVTLIFGACCVCILSLACVHLWKRLLAQRVQMMIRGRQLWRPFISAKGDLVKSSVLFSLSPPEGFEKNPMLKTIRSQNEAKFTVEEKMKLRAHVQTYGYGEKLSILQQHFVSASDDAFLNTGL